MTKMGERLVQTQLYPRIFTPFDKLYKMFDHFS